MNRANIKPIQKKIHKIVLTALLLLSNHSFAQIAGYVYHQGYTQTSPTTTIANETVSNITSSASAISYISGTGALSSTGWSTTYTLGAYWEFSITPAAGYAVSISSFQMDVQNANSGPQSFALLYSTDGFATSADVTSYFLNHTITTGLGTKNAGSLTIANTANPITFRIYGYLAGSSSGSFILNNVIVQGSITPNSFYSAATGNLDVLATWSSNANGVNGGTGSSPTDFTSGQVFHVANGNAGNLSNSWSVAGTLDLSNGTVNLSNKTLTVGTITGGSTSHYFTGSASSGLVVTGNTTNTIYMNPTNSVTATLGSLTLNNNATAALGNNLNIASGSSAGSVNINTGATLTTNNNLTLLATATGAARIGTYTGTITGNVNIQTYLNGQRGYRLLGNPFSTDIRLDTLGHYFDIYTAANTTHYGNGGAGCSSNGNTVYAVDPTKPYNYDPSFVNANITSISHNTGYLVFVRGQNGQGCLTQSYTPSAIVPRISGAVNQGGSSLDQTVPAGKWAIITNPLPSQITIPTVSGTTLMYIVEPGGQAWFPGHNDSKFTQVNAGDVIPIGGAFLANNSTGSAITYHFAETDKTSSTISHTPFKTTNQLPELNIDVLHRGSVWDTWSLVLQPLASPDATDDEDFFKLSNANLDLYSLSADSQRLFIDNRDADSIADGSTIAIGLRCSTPDTFAFQITDYTMPSYKTVYLHDKYANTYVPIYNGISYGFFVTTDPATAGEKRFELLFNDVTTTGTNNPGTQMDKLRILPNPAKYNITLLFDGTIAGDKQINIINAMGEVVKRINTNEQALHLYIGDVPNGIYFVKTTTLNNTVSARFVKY